MMFFYLLLFTFVVENPRITHDTLQGEKNFSAIDSTNAINIIGEKFFSASGEDGSADIFQSTNILVNGKTENGWQVEGVLYDERMKPTDDIYTIGLSDVNTAYLTFHRKRDSFTLGRFSFYDRGIDGVSIKYARGPLQIKAGGGKTRGAAGVFDTILTPPYDVPVKITMKGIDFFTIVEKSERVFINGRRLSEDAYSMDYSRCIITLHIDENKPQISLKVEFEYHAPFESPYIYATEVHYNSTFLKTGIRYLNESTPEKYKYDSIGGVYLPNGGGDYEKKDSFFVYVGNGRGHYRVFFRLDTINGSYNYDNRGYYVFTGRGKGNYSPVIFDRLPSLRDIKEINIKVGNRVYTKLGFITSSEKTSGKSGRGGTISAGLQTKTINIEVGFRKKEGEPEYIIGRFDSVRNEYVNSIENEKFAHLGIKGKKWDGHLSFSYDTMPAWLFNINVFNFGLYSRGNRDPQDIMLKYRLHNSTFYAFNTSGKMQGISVDAEILPQTTITGIVFRDSNRLTHYIASLKHSTQYKLTKVKTSFTKTDNLFLYSLSSSIIGKNAFLSLEFTRSMDFAILYMERYVKAPDGNFIYDSTSGMIPSQFGEYTRIITEGQSDNTAYRYTYSVSGYLKEKSWRGNSSLAVERISDNQKATVSFNVEHIVLKGSMLSAKYETRHYTTTDNNLQDGYESNLKFLAFQRFWVTPSIFEIRWKDVFSGIQKYSTGAGLLFKMHNIKINTEISKNRHSFIKETYYRIKTESEINLSKTRLTLSLAYSTLNSTSILPDARYIGISGKRNLKIGTLNNVLNAYLYIPSDKKIRWAISTTLKF